MTIPARCRFCTFGRSISRFVDERRKRRQLEFELNTLGAMGCLDGALADVGLVRSQIGPLIADSSRSRATLDRMLDRLGLDAEAVEDAGELDRDVAAADNDQLFCDHGRSVKRHFARPCILPDDFAFSPVHTQDQASVSSHVEQILHDGGRGDERAGGGKCHGENAFLG